MEKDAVLIEKELFTDELTGKKEKINVITKDLIESELMDCRIDHKGVAEPSQIFCNKIEYIHDKLNDMSFEHCLNFWKRGEPVFRVLLPNSKNEGEFESINEALESCGVRVKIDVGKE